MLRYFLPILLLLSFSPLQAAENTIRIGVLTPLTSASHVFGRDHLQAITLAIEEANRNPILGKYRLQLVVQDDQSNPTLALENARQLDRNEVVAVLGPCNSSVALAIINNVLQPEALKLPFISALSTAPEITEEFRHPLFFRANVSDNKRMAETIALVVQSTHPEKIALVYEGHGDPYGEGMKAAAEKTIRDQFAKVTTSAAFEHERNLARPKAAVLVQTLKAQGYGGSKSAIVFLDLDYDSQTLAEEARDLGFESHLYLVESDHRRIEGALRQGKNLGGLRTVSAFYPKNAALHPFPPAFKAKFGEDITFASALSYDAAQILIGSIRAVAARDATIIQSLPRFRAEIAKEIAQGDHRDIRFVLSGNQQFSNNEYTSLQFNGYHFTNQAKIVPWDEALGDPFPQAQEKAKPPTPNVVHFLITILAAVVGSWLRKILRGNFAGVPWKEYFTALKDARVLVVDPGLAALLFPCVYLWILTYQLDWFYSMGGPSVLFPWGALVIGSICGLGGTAVFNKLLSLLGLDDEDAKAKKRAHRPDPEAAPAAAGK